ncbi:MAG: hypothetical protein IKQ75_10310 [Bacteroidales bacterium]|nr:hypothetical protein [Bacteroidales bacterium]
MTDGDSAAHYVRDGMVRSACLNKTGRWAADSQRPEIPPPPTVVGGMVRNAA